VFELTIVETHEPYAMTAESRQSDVDRFRTLVRDQVEAEAHAHMWNFYVHSLDITSTITEYTVTMAFEAHKKAEVQTAVSSPLFLASINEQWRSGVDNDINSEFSQGAPYFKDAGVTSTVRPPSPPRPPTPPPLPPLPPPPTSPPPSPPPSPGAPILSLRTVSFELHEQFTGTHPFAAEPGETSASSEATSASYATQLRPGFEAALGVHHLYLDLHENIATTTTTASNSNSNNNGWWRWDATAVVEDAEYNAVKAAFGTEQLDLELTTVARQLTSPLPVVVSAVNNSLLASNPFLGTLR
jgi:hypothetical protein